MLCSSLPSTHRREQAEAAAEDRGKSREHCGGPRFQSPLLTSESAHWSHQTWVRWKNTQSHKWEDVAKAFFPKLACWLQHAFICWNAPMQPWIWTIQIWQSLQGHSSPCHIQIIRWHLNQTAYLLLSCNAQSMQSLCLNYTVASPRPAGLLSSTWFQRGRCKVHWACLLT